MARKDAWFGARTYSTKGLALLWNIYASSACLRSAMMSSASSRPTDMRIMPSVMPAASRTSRGIIVCVMAAACSTSVSVSPSDTASEQSLRWLMKRLPASRPPRTSKVIMPPPPRIWRRAISYCAQAWYDLGARRVVLARELSLNEIREIRSRVSPELELETFCHGAMCVSYSGRCLLSNYMTGRDSNRGACAQPCRYQYALMEEKRPGEYFPVFEDEKGTYIMNSRDMCMIDHLPELMEAGVDCLKIEGRAKSAYYAAIVTGAYRHCLDDAAAGRPADPVWRDEVDHISHRRYSTGFFFGQPGQYYQNSRYIRDWQICAVVTDCDADGHATLSLRNKFAMGDEVELVGPDTRPFTMTVPLMEDADGLPLTEPRTPQMVFRMQFPRPVPPMSFVRHAVELSAKE